MQERPPDRGHGNDRSGTANTGKGARHANEPRARPRRETWGLLRGTSQGGAVK
jgi:hypothetical protein